MKKLLKTIIIISIAFTIAACSGGGSSSGGSGSGAKKVADDLDVMAMHISAPAEYETVERYTEYRPDGSIIEKDILFNLSDTEGYTYAFAGDSVLADMTDVSKLEQFEENGKTVYRYDSGDNMMAFIQVDKDLYAVDYTTSEKNEDKLRELVKGVSFTNKTTTIVDDTSLNDIQYKIDDRNLAETGVRREEDPKGNLIAKTVTWYFGEDENNVDFRFMIRVYANSKLEDVLSESKTYEQKEINGITYSSLVNDDGNPSYEYSVQHGDDVYMIRNNGSSNGWFTNRSEESYTAFETFMNNISFK